MIAVGQAFFSLGIGLGVLFTIGAYMDPGTSIVRAGLVVAAADVGVDRVLTGDPEDLTAHFNLALVYADLGDAARAEAHRALVDRYRPDDHAVERAATRHRRANPAADHAAEAVAIYDLQRTPTEALAVPATAAGTGCTVTATVGAADGQGS